MSASATAMIGVGVGGLLVVDLGMAVLTITVAGGMLNSGGGVSMIGVALGMNVAAVGIINAALGMNVAAAGFFFWRQHSMATSSALPDLSGEARATRTCVSLRWAEL